MLLDNVKHRGAQQADNVHATFADVEWTTMSSSNCSSWFTRSRQRPPCACRRQARGADRPQPGGRRFDHPLWVSAILSAILDNIPFVATMIPLIKGMAPAFGGPNAIEPLWWCLSLGACLGGNGTLTGASANLVVAGIAQRNGIRFGFVQYLRCGVPMTFISIAICQAYVWLRYYSSVIPDWACQRLVKARLASFMLQYHVFPAFCGTPRNTRTWMSRCGTLSNARAVSTDAPRGLLVALGEVGKVALGRRHDVIRESSECAAPLGPLDTEMRTPKGRRD